MFILNKKTLDNDPMSATVSGTSIDVSSSTYCAVQIVWSAGSTPVGSLQIEGSCDGSTFSAVGSAVSISGNTGNSLTNLGAIGYPYIRATYTRTSGSGTLNVYISTKG